MWRPINFLMSHAKGMSTTFHRAFDRCKEPEKVLEQLISLGFDRVLTSGQQPTAELGIPLLRRLEEIVKRAHKDYGWLWSK